MAGGVRGVEVPDSGVPLPPDDVNATRSVERDPRVEADTSDVWRRLIADRRAASRALLLIERVMTGGAGGIDGASPAELTLSSVGDSEASSEPLSSTASG